jgi:hypothetical protein
MVRRTSRQPTAEEQEVIDHFDQYGYNDGKLSAWQKLCRKVGTQEGTSIRQCKKVGSQWWLRSGVTKSSL